MKVNVNEYIIALVTLYFNIEIELQNVGRNLTTPA